MAKICTKYAQKGSKIDFKWLKLNRQNLLGMSLSRLLNYPTGYAPLFPAMPDSLSLSSSHSPSPSVRTAVVAHSHELEVFHRQVWLPKGIWVQPMVPKNCWSSSSLRSPSWGIHGRTPFVNKPKSNSMWNSLVGPCEISEKISLFPARAP